jgi:hypothetical protein
VNDFNPEDYPPHLQSATDPAGRRYWIQGVPAFGHSGRALFSWKPGLPDITGMVMVERVEGDKRTEVFMLRCDTLEEARGQSVTLAEQIEAGDFRDQPPG